ncbi:MAG: glycosyltransferase family 2 protein [Sandarakinorhabdus sp.]|jgi:GT2 family glycosyltransferase
MSGQVLPPMLGVVLVNFRGAADTIECLESLLRCPLQMKIVVVENGSGDDSVSRLRDWAAGNVRTVAESPEMAGFSTPPMAKPIAMAEVAAEAVGNGAISPLSLIISPDNLGFAGGNNLGLRHLRADPRLTAFWLLNNDTVVTPEAPGALLVRMLATPRVGMCGTVVRHYWAPNRLQALNGSSFNLWTGMGKSLGGEEPAMMKYSPQDVADATDYVLGASLTVSRSFLDTVGPMAEDYFLYYEEVDWAWRNRRLGTQGFEIAFAHGATIFHKAGSSIGSGSARSERSPFSDYWLNRSRLKFIWRFARALWPWHWALSWGLVLRRLIRRKPAHARAIARAALGLKP